jgi:cytoskeleton protein RodZ
VSDVKAGPGSALLAERQAREIAVHEVAEVLNLPIGTVEAIEENNYELLPSAVFAKGYIRAYARLLEMDSDALVAAFPDAPTEVIETDTAVREQIGDFLRTYPRWVLGGAGALAILLLTLLVIWVWPDSNGVAEAKGDADAKGALAVRSAPSTDLSPPAPVGQTGQAQQASAVEWEAPPVQAGSERVAPVVAAEPQANDGTGRRISPDGQDRLRFQFTDECWVEIKSGSGTSMFSELGRAGQSLELVGRAPFRILLGYAPGVAMAFNDEPVALAPHTRNNVANLVLGQ